MDLFLAISQGTGLALATGVRPFLPPLLAGALARAGAGLDFDGTDYAFLESTPFLAVMVLLALATLLEERLGSRRATVAAFSLVAVAVGALEFAGSLADEGYAAWPGLAGGVACAAASRHAGLVFLGRARRRLEAREGERTPPYLNLYADGAALALAGLAVLAPPLSYAALAMTVWVVVEHRRRAERRYEGLRILR